MKKVKFQINNKIEFLFEDGPGVSLIQDVQKDYILVTIPMKRISVKHLSKEEEIYGFYYDDNDVYMFTTYMIERVFENIPLYKLAFPKIIKKVQRRNYVRIPISLPVLYLESNENLEREIIENCAEDLKDLYWGQWKKATTLDLSGGGMKLSSKKLLKLDSKYIFLFKLDELTIGVKGRVVRFIPTIYKKHVNYQVGIEFQDIAENKRDQIIGFVFKKLREERQKM